MKIEDIITEIYNKIKEKENPKTVIMNMNTYRLIELYKYIANKSRNREVKIDYFQDESIFGIPILIDNVTEVIVI